MTIDNGLLINSTDFKTKIADFIRVKLEQRNIKGLVVTFTDRVLIRLEAGLSIQEIFQETNLSLDAIEKVSYYYNASNYARNVPFIL